MGVPPTPCIDEAAGLPPGAAGTDGVYDIDRSQKANATTTRDQIEGERSHAKREASWGGFPGARRNPANAKSVRRGMQVSDGNEGR